jgi:hypothetical protein
MLSGVLGTTGIAEPSRPSDLTYRSAIRPVIRDPNRFVIDGITPLDRAEHMGTVTVTRVVPASPEDVR